MLKQIVAGGLVAIVALATAVRPACATACQRATDRAAAATASASPSAPASHCARMGHAAPPAASRLAATHGHPCGDHAAIANDDARLPRVDPGVAMPAIGETAVSVIAPSPASRLVDARHSGLPPPGPPRAPLVLRV